MGSNDNSTSYTQSESSPSLLGSIITQRDADLLHFVLKVYDLSIFLTNSKFFKMQISNVISNLYINPVA